jgi:O-antigen/teichoic acid export membrane protein
MSRLRRAAVSASFGYLQYGLAIVSGFVLVPLTLAYVGPRAYGLWLASGELLGYAAIVDLGVMGVLPWMLAEADGRQDRAGMRSLVANGAVVGLAVGLGFALFTAVLWMVLPSALSLTADDRRLVGPPLALLVIAVTIAYPLRVFNAVVSGLQDVTFNGLLTVTQTLLAVFITFVMLARGSGLYALAVASAASTLVSACGALARTRVIAPDLLRDWPRPTRAMVRHLLTNGLGVWFGAFGWQLLAASNGLVMMALGHPEWVAVYACTAKLTSMATQLAWVTPDAGLIGLAQVHGEGRAPDRLRPLVLMMLRLHLLLAGGAACGLLAFNPAFVSRWVGADLFGGVGLNALLVSGVVVYSLIHGVLTAAAVVGHRIRVGALTLVNGALQVVCAWLLGRIWGLPGVAAAGLLTGLLTAVPAGTRLLRASTALTMRQLWSDVLDPWLRRAAPIAAVSALAGLFHQDLGLPGGLAIGVSAGLAYIWHLRPLYAGLPFDPRWRRWLVSLRLMTASAAPAEQG